MSGWTGIQSEVFIYLGQTYQYGIYVSFTFTKCIHQELPGRHPTFSGKKCSKSVWWKKSRLSRSLEDGKDLRYMAMVGRGFQTDGNCDSSLEPGLTLYFKAMAPQWWWLDGPVSFILAMASALVSSYAFSFFSCAENSTPAPGFKKLDLICRDQFQFLLPGKAKCQASSAYNSKCSRQWPQPLSPLPMCLFVLPHFVLCLIPDDVCFFSSFYLALNVLCLEHQECFTMSPYRSFLTRSPWIRFWGVIHQLGWGQDGIEWGEMAWYLLQSPAVADHAPCKGTMQTWSYPRRHQQQKEFGTHSCVRAVEVLALNCIQQQAEGHNVVWTSNSRTMSWG